jgi:hypothetical protein
LNKHYAGLATLKSAAKGFLANSHTPAWGQDSAFRQPENASGPHVVRGFHRDEYVVGALYREETCLGVMADQNDPVEIFQF